MNQEIITKRTEVCLTCKYFQEQSCTMCGCPNMGLIDKEYSRCPLNLWEDGWGDNPTPQIEEYIPQELEISVYDEYTNSTITSIIFKKEIEIKDNHLYTFKNEEEMIRFNSLKNKFGLI